MRVTRGLLGAAGVVLVLVGVYHLLGTGLSDLVDLAVEAGAEESDVRDGIEKLAMEDWVTEATTAAHDAHVSSTPTVLLDGEELTGYSSVDDLSDQILKEVG